MESNNKDNINDWEDQSVDDWEDQPIDDWKEDDTSDEPSTIGETAEAGAAGLAKGAMFGFDEEAGAAAQTGFDRMFGSMVDSDREAEKMMADADIAAGNEVKPATGLTTEYGDLYKESQEENEERTDAIREESPTAFGVGELAGGLTSGIATGGLGQIGKGANVLGKLGRAASIGAAEGGLYGAGESEGNLIGGSKEEQIKFLRDTGQGAAFGAAAGGALQGAGSALKGAKSTAKKGLGKVDDYLSDYDFYEALKKGGKMGDDGIILGPKGKRERARIHGLEGKIGDDYVRENASKISDIVLDADSRLTGEFGKVIKNHTQPIKVNELLEPLLDKAERELAASGGDPALSKYVAEVKRVAEKGDISAQELQDLKAYASKSMDTRDLPYYTRDILSDASNKLNDALKTKVKGYKEVSDNLKMFRENIIENVLDPRDYSNVRYSDIPLNDRNVKFRESMDKVLDRYSTGEIERGAHRTFDKIFKILEKGDETSKKLLKVMKISPDKFKKQVYETADAAAAVEQATRKTILNPTRATIKGSIAEQLAGVGTQMGAKFLNRYRAKSGVAGGIRKGAEAIADSPNKLSELATSPIKGIAEVLQQDPANFLQKVYKNPATAQYGKLLEKAIAEDNQPMQNAILYLISTNENAKEAAFGEGDE